MAVEHVPNPYCTRGDVNRWIPSGEITGSTRLIESANATTNVLTLDGHGLETDDECTVRALTGGTLSAPLVAGTTYYAIRLSNSTFSLATAAAGSAIDLTTTGVSMFISKAPPYDDVIEFYSRFVDGFMPGHLVPFTSGAVPVTVKVLVAELAAKKLLNLDGKTSEIVNQAELAAKAQLERFAKGIPVRESVATASANLAVSSTLGNTVDPRGWCPSGSGSLP